VRETATVSKDAENCSKVFGIVCLSFKLMTAYLLAVAQAPTKAAAVSLLLFPPLAFPLLLTLFAH